MRRGVGLLLVTACVIGGLTGPVAHGDDTSTTESTSAPSTTEGSATTEATTTSTVAPTTVPPAPAVPDSPAQRTGTVLQVTPTLAEPPVTISPYSTELPANSGEGRRVVYSKSRMRVWIIESNGAVARTYRVSGKMSQPRPGTYSVFSRSSYTCNIDNPNICMRWMVRFTKGPSGDNIGFHEIPRRNGVVVQSDSQLGQALSGGCIRQGTSDASFMWNWASVGTKVVVTP